MSTPPTPPSPPSPYTPPAAGGPPAVTDEGKRLPWEERERLGFVEALTQTIRLLVTDPREAYARLRADGDLTSPILFGIIVSAVALLIHQMWRAFLASSLRGILRDVEGLENVFREPTTASVLVTLVLWPILFVILLFLGSAFLHMCLALVGAMESSPMGFEGTLKVAAYSQVAGLAAILPAFGGLVILIWSMILGVIGFAAVHRTTRGKALAGVLIPVLACCACVTLAAVFFGAMIAALFAGLSPEMAR